jgi:ABC-type nitrate/sulfonate/bicarbonate transport system substrate-binding protein
MVAALETNAIDAMVASSPYSGAPVLKGTGVLWLNGPGGDFPADAAPPSTECLMTTNSAAAANADLIRRFRATLDDVATLIKQKPDEAKRALGKAYPQLEPAALNLAFSQQADNWTHPQFSEADVRQQIKLLQAVSHLPGLDKVQPQAILLKTP